MAHEIVLFHSALGLRPGVRSWAERLRGLGHTVHTPDLYDGEYFADLDDGVKKRDAIGIPGLIERANQAVAALPTNLVYAGFSMGAAPAELLAANRPGARGAILMHGAVPPEMAGIQTWPQVPVQVHYSDGDPWIEPGEIESFEKVVRAAGVRLDVHVYPGREHLFADPDLADYRPAHASAMFDRVAAFLAELP